MALGPGLVNYRSKDFMQAVALVQIFLYIGCFVQAGVWPTNLWFAVIVAVNSTQQAWIRHVHRSEARLCAPHAVD